MNRFDELLPFYVNGTLDAAERDWVEAWLREHPQDEGVVHFTQTLQTRLRADVPAVSSEVGLERALGRIRSEGPRPALARRATPPTFGERVRGWLAALVPQPVLKPALAAALAVVAVQAVVIVAYHSGREEWSDIRALGGGAAVEQGPYVKLNFKADAREADIRMLLIEAQASLAAGPGQLGDYYLRVPAARVDQIKARLEASAIVEGVAVVDALPARP